MKYSFLVVVSSLLAAISLVITETTLRYFVIDPLVIAIIGNAVGGTILLSSAVHGRVDLSKLRRWPDLVVISLAALCTYTVAYLLHFYAIHQIGAGKMALLGQLETVFVVILAILFLGERISARHWWSGGLALFGAVLINFDLEALQFKFSWGELWAILAAAGFATGIVMLKPILDRADARWVTGVSLLLGAFFLTFLTPFIDSPVRLEAALLVLIAAIGLARGGSWLTYYLGFQYIGVSKSAIIFISFAFFTLILQAALAMTLPALGLKFPTNPLGAVVGGVLVALGIVILHLEPEGERAPIC